MPTAALGNAAIEQVVDKFIQEYHGGIYDGTLMPQILPHPDNFKDLIFNHSSGENVQLIIDLLKEAIELKKIMVSQEQLSYLEWVDLKKLQDLAQNMLRKIRAIPATTEFLRQVKVILSEWINPLFTLNFSRMAQPPFTIVPKEKTCFFEKKVFIPGTDEEVPETRFYWGLGQNALHNWKTVLQFTAASTPPGIRQPWHYHERIGEYTIVIKGELTRASINKEGLDRVVVHDGERIYYEVFTTHTLENESPTVVKNLTVKPRKAENDKIDLPIKGKELTIDDLPPHLWNGSSSIIAPVRTEGDWGFTLEHDVTLPDGEHYVVRIVTLKPGAGIDCDKKGFEVTWVVEGQIEVSSLDQSSQKEKGQANTDDWVVRFPYSRVRYANHTDQKVLICRVINLTE